MDVYIGALNKRSTTTAQAQNQLSVLNAIFANVRTEAKAAAAAAAKKLKAKQKKADKADRNAATAK